MSSRNVQTVTSLPESPDAERSRRFRNYTIAMLIRTLCVLALLILPSPWLWIAAFGAIFLPYFAVVIANAAGTDNKTPKMESPQLKIETGA